MATGRDRIILAGHDRAHGHQLQVHPQHRYEGGSNGPTAGQVLAVLTGLPVGGTLLALSGFTLLGTLIGLAVAIPLFVVFSPLIVPAVVVIGLALTAILTSGAFGITGLWSLSWVANYLREATGMTECPLEEAKRKVQDMTSYVTSKARSVGIVGLFILVWTVKNIRAAMTGMTEDQQDEAERKDRDMRSYIGEKTKDLGQGIQNTAHSRIGDRDWRQ